MTDLSPERIENAARALHAKTCRCSDPDGWTKDAYRSDAEAVLRADTEWRARNERPADYSWQNGFEAGKVITRDQALAAIAHVSETSGLMSDCPPARVDACRLIEAEFLRRIGEGETDADS